MSYRSIRLKPCVRRHVPIAALFVFAFALLFVGQAKADPLVIQPGQDGFITQPGSTATLPALPVGFFGMRGGFSSDPIPMMMIGVMSGPNLVAVPVVTTFLTGPGCHTGMVNLHCYQQQRITLVPIYDTVVERTGGAIPGIGDTLGVGITLVHLSLQSVVPLRVTYGSIETFWDVFVSLDGAQDPGALLLRRITEEGGTMDTTLPVRYRVDFIERSGPGVVGVGNLTDTLTSQGNTWTTVPEPSSITLISVGLLGLAKAIKRRRVK